MRSQLEKDLRAARALVARGLCQGAGARDANGKLLLSSEPDAATFCSLGAVYRVFRRSGRKDDIYGLDSTLDALGVGYAPDWHDTQQTLEDVLKVWDAAIQREAARS